MLPSKAGVQNPTFAAKPSTSTDPMQICLEVRFSKSIPVRSIFNRKVIVDNQSDLEKTKTAVLLFPHKDTKDSK